MKIYSMKSFMYGLASLTLGIGVFVTAERPVGVKPFILAMLCAAIGASFVLRSFSHKIARADKLEELDERNQLIALNPIARPAKLHNSVAASLR